jgi:hypothetical protein
MAAAMCPEVANDCSHAVAEIADLTPALMPKKTPIDRKALQSLKAAQALLSRRDEPEGGLLSGPKRGVTLGVRDQLVRQPPPVRT